MGVRVQLLRCKSFDAASAVLVEAAINAWLATAGERTFIEAHYAANGAGSFTCLIFYTE